MQTSIREDLYSRAQGRNIIAKREHHPQPFPTHWHQFGELLFVRDGELNVNVAGNNYLLKKGSMLFISPCELHSILPGSEPVASLLQYDASLLNHFPSIASHLQSNHSSLVWVSQEQNPLLYPKLRDFFEEIICLQESNQEAEVDPFYDVQQYMILCQMHLLRFVEERKLPQHRAAEKNWNAASMRIVQEVCVCISQNYDSSISLTMLADQFGLSVSHFSRIFERYADCSFSTYLARCRLSHAKMMLANPKNKITDIAFQAGFGSLAAFNRTFVKYEGMSPKEFRNLYYSYSKYMDKQ